MSGDFDYQAAWHVLAGWVNGMADDDRWHPLPERVREELAAAYLFAVQRGMPGEALEAA